MDLENIATPPMKNIKRPSFVSFYTAVGASGSDHETSIIKSIWEDYVHIYKGIISRSITFKFNRQLFFDVLGEEVSDMECRLMSEHLRQEIIEHPEEMATFTKYLCMGLIRITGN